MKQSFRRLLLIVWAAIFVGVSAFAQVTTSSLAGRITDDSGEPIVGVAILATHTPSGTVYGVVTNNDGRYTINGMRAGGPYSVEISCLGYQTTIYTDVTLELAETYSLNSVINEDSELLEQAVVIAAPTSKFAAAEKTGASTNISREELTSMPTVSRSITDFTRLSAYGGNGMTFSGTDGRTANFTVDGANFNNNFGLSSNLPGGGNPISIDAIEEMQIVISPFDVRQSNFVGGGVNAITKSGTNDFKGTAYIYHKNENMQGDAVAGEQISGAREKDRTTTYGFTLGGPIIKNKLFFFVNAELSKIPSVVNRWRGSEDGVADADNYISRTLLSDLQAVKDYVNDKYGYDTGSYTSFPADEFNYKILARLDWNITQNHHLAVRYNYTKNRYWATPSNTSMDGGTRMSGNRMSQYAMSYANSMYAQDNLVNTISVDLNSRLSDNVSNQLLFTYSQLDDVRASESDEFPFIDILKDDQNYISLGYELFTYHNAVHNTIWNIKDDITWFKGNHKIMLGASFEHQMADNQYMRNGTGYYRYKSLDDFFNGAAPEVVNLTYGYNGEDYPAVRVRFEKAGIYAQDEWTANDKFKLTYGLRIDGIFFNNRDLMTNNALKAIDFNGYSMDTGKWPNNSINFSPRIGFTWDPLGNKSLKVRGGTGLFMGRLPLVFFTNMPTNSGMIQNNAIYSEASGNDMSAFAGGLVTDANRKVTIDAIKDKFISLGYADSFTPDDGTVSKGSGYCGVDSKFKMPQVWKTSLALDYTFPVSFPFTATVEGIYNKTVNGTTIVDKSIPNVGGFARFNGADDRPIYPAGFRSTAGNPDAMKALVLTNTSKGYGWIGSVTLKAKPARWVDLMASYTHTVSKEITSLPGSNAESAFTYVPTVEGPNNIRLHNGVNVTPDRYIVSATFNDKCGNHFGLIYEAWRGGYNYSFMTTNDMNGDGYNYDALYIPTDKQVENNEFRFVSENDRDRFMAYVHNNKYLSKHQGEYAEAYSYYSPWVHRLDFSYKHDFKLNIGKTQHTLQLSFDVKNLLNLFNSNWGVMKIINPEIGTEARILKYEGVDADGYATFSTPSAINGNTQTFVKYHALSQCWYASIGIKYFFN